MIAHPTTNARLQSAWCSVFALGVVLSGLALEYPRYGATFARTRVYFGKAGDATDRVFYPDPDDYTRVWRAKRIATGAERIVRHVTEINHPAGITLHWTAPMDYLLAGAGLLVGPFTDHPDPIGFVAAFVPPLLGAAYVALMMGWLKRGFGWGPALLAGLMIVVSPPFHRVFQLGHPDHQALLELLFLVGVGVWMPRRRADGAFAPPTRADAILGGLAIGLAIWVASQAMIVWGAVLVGLVSACRSRDATTRRAFRSARRLWNFAVAAVVLIGVVLENRPDLTTAVIDKVSLIHLALVLIAFLLPAGPTIRAREQEETVDSSDTAPPVEETTSAGEQARITRMIALLAGAAGFTIWMAVRSDQILAPLNKPALARWHTAIAELQPLYAHVGSSWSFKPMHQRLGFLPYALPMLIVLFWLSRSVPRIMQRSLGLLAPLLALLAVLQLRWMDHYNLAVVPVVVLVLWERTGRWFGRSVRPKPVVQFALCGVVLGLLGYPANRRLLTRTAQQELASRPLIGRTDFVAQAIADHEHRFGPSPPGRRAILCADGDGPMLLYETGLPVVAAPYHRAIDGIVEVAKFFAERDPVLARQQLDRLGVRFVVVPYRAHEQLMHFERTAFGAWRSFDTPEPWIDETGRVRLQLRYKAGFTETMVYRLWSAPRAPCIAGLKLIRGVTDDPTRPRAENGLLFVVEELPPED